MGVADRKPPLPPPTEPSTLSSMTGGSVAGTTDLATDLSRRSERTSYSIPDDGSPITISTRPKRQDRAKETNSTLTTTHHSQTSLLIEYFEGGKGNSLNSRPSVRVKVTPSAARKIRDANDHIQISETGRTRQPSYTRRISLGSPKVKGERIITEGDDKSVSSYASATEESNLAQRPPIEIEVMHKDHGSPVSAASSPGETRYITQNGSEISSIPPSSFLDGKGSSRNPQRARSRSLTRGTRETTTEKAGELKTPSRRRSRSLSRERITQKVIEKLEKKEKSKSRSRSASKEYAEGMRTPRRKTSRSHREEEIISGAESSVLTNPAFSPSRKSGDQYSMRSGTSRSSINNPRLLETVEDAIRRLILPELNALKTQTNRDKFDRAQKDSVMSGSSLSREETTRRLSKTSSAPDVSIRPAVVVTKGTKESGGLFSGTSTVGSKKERRRDRGLGQSPSEKSIERISEETITDEKINKKRSKDRHGLKELAAAGAAGALTAAALSHHDSKSSLEKKERRKKRDKSRSRSVSVTESVESIHQRRMPLEGSDLNPSEVTRQSILTERTETSRGLRTPTREASSPASRTPTRTPQLQTGLQTHHSNFSQGDLSLHSAHSDRSLRKEEPHSKAVEEGLAGAAVGAVLGAVVAGHDKHDKHDEHDDISEHDYAYEKTNNRGLSPIQSVASNLEEENYSVNKNHVSRNLHNSGSLSSLDRLSHRQGSAISIKSMSSAPSTKLAQSKRSQGNSDKREAIVSQDPLPDSELMYDPNDHGNEDVDRWFVDDVENRRRGSVDDGSVKDSPHYLRMTNMTNYTDDSTDGAYLDKVATGQHVLGIGANPEYRSTPEAVRSYVASLHEPSMVDVRSNRSGRGIDTYADSEKDIHMDDAYDETQRSRGVYEDDGHSVSQKGSTTYNRAVESPRQSVSSSRHESQEKIHMSSSGIPRLDEPMPEIGHGLDNESEISTNPSIIHGPIGGVAQSSHDHWPYEPTPPQSNGNLIRDEHHGMNAVEAGLLGAAVGAGVGTAASHSHHDDRDKEFLDGHNYEHEYLEDYGRGEDPDFGLGQIRDSYQSGATIPPTPVPKDEGYISAANPGVGSPVGLTPEPRQTGLQFLDNDGLAGIDDVMVGEDPFYTSKSHQRHASGNSHGMPSPLYDSSTGRGIDRIQSKDIVALMDHLTVRDAQRNARDTEMLVTLVRSAAEMRNSFEDMKRLLDEKERNINDTTEKVGDRTVQRIIQGPRPQPLGTPRFPRRSSADDEIEDIPNKRRNVFRRALKGLSGRSSNDLAKIEDMLVQLLGEVEGLKAAQELHTTGTRSQPNSLHSYDNLQNVQQGYEPEGQAGTGSTDPSGFFSNPPSRQHSGMRGFDGRRASDHRISTVPEGDEELATHDQALGTKNYLDDEVVSPVRKARGGSVPLDTPPHIPVPTAAHSNENTPKTERHKKHKSSSSSFLPKISRWSESTTASIAKGFRSSGRKDKEQEYQEPASRSGSELDVWNDYTHDPHGADRIRSTESLEGHQHRTENQRPPSPLLPPEQEDPKYQAHRNSLNLQHPQPRPGPTQRFQNHLESQAQNFGSPKSPLSDGFGSASSLDRYAGRNSNRYSGGAGNLSPISDGGYSQQSVNEVTNLPPRPPKIPEEPMVPPRPAKTKSKDNKPQYASPLSSGHLAPESNEWSNEGTGAVSSRYDQMNGSPNPTRSPSSGVPQRKPTGPRPLSSTSSGGLGKSGTVRNKKRGSNS